MTHYKIFIASVRKVQKSLEHSSFKLFVDTINRLGLAEDFKIIDSRIMCISTGAVVIFTGLQDAKSIKSLESAHILFAEESNDITIDDWDIIIPTLRAKGWEIWAVWNPSSPTDGIEIIKEREKKRAIHVHTTYLDNKFLDKSKVEEAENMKTHDPASYAHHYLGAYRETGEDVVVGLKDIVSATERIFIEPLVKVPKIASFDPALNGGDSAALVIRQGDKILSIKEWAKSNAPDLEASVYRICVENGVAMLIMDADGLGAPMLQHMVKDFPDLLIIGFHGNGACSEPGYQNARAECWFKMGKAIQTTLVLPKNKQLIDELQRQKFEYAQNGTVKIPSKATMKSKGIPSPNIADALMMSYSHLCKVKPITHNRSNAEYW